MKPTHLKMLRLMRTFSLSPFERNIMKAGDLFRDTPIFEKCSYAHCTLGVVGTDKE